MADTTDTTEVATPPDTGVTDANKQSRKKLYDLVSQKFNVGDFKMFDTKMNIPESRKKFFDLVSSKFNLGDFPTFENKVGRVMSVPKEAGQANILFETQPVTAEAPSGPITKEDLATSPKLQEGLSKIPQPPSIGDKAAFREKYGDTDPREVSEIYNYLPGISEVSGILRGEEAMAKGITDKNVGEFGKAAVETASSAVGTIPVIGATSALLGAGRAAVETIPGAKSVTPYLFEPVQTITKPKTEGQKALAEVADNLLFLAGGLGISLGVEGVKSIARNRFATELREAVTPSDLRSMFARVKSGVGTPQEVELTQTIAKAYAGEGELATKEGQPISGIDIVRGRAYHPSTPRWLRKILGDFPPSKIYPRFEFTGKAEEAPPPTEPTTEQPIPPKGLAGEPPLDTETGEPAKTTQPPPMNQVQRRQAIIESMYGNPPTEEQLTGIRDDLLKAGYDGTKIAKLGREDLVLAYNGDTDALTKITSEKPVVQKSAPITEQEVLHRSVRKKIVDTLGADTETRFGKVENLADTELITLANETKLFKDTPLNEYPKEALQAKVDAGEITQEQADAAWNVKTGDRNVEQIKISKAYSDDINTVKQLIADGVSNEEIFDRLSQRIKMERIETVRKALKQQGTVEATVGADSTLPVTMSVEINGQEYGVGSFEKASKQWLKLRDQLNLAPGEAGPVHITDQYGKTIGHIDYNGRIYEGSLDQHTNDTKILYQPEDEPVEDISVTQTPGTPAPPNDAPIVAQPPAAMTGSTVTVEAKDEKGYPTELKGTNGTAKYNSTDDRDEPFWSVDLKLLLRYVLREADARMILGESRETAESLSMPTDRPEAKTVGSEYKIVQPKNYYGYSPIQHGYILNKQAIPVNLPGYEDLDLFATILPETKTITFYEGMTGRAIATSQNPIDIAIDNLKPHLDYTMARHPHEWQDAQSKIIKLKGVSPRYALRGNAPDLTKPKIPPTLPTEGEGVTYGDPITGTTDTQTGRPDVESTPGLDEGEPAGAVEGIVPTGETEGTPGRKGGTSGGRSGETTTPAERPTGGVRNEPGGAGGRPGGHGRPGTGSAAGNPATPDQPVGTSADQPPEQLAPTDVADFNHVILPEHNIVPAGEIGRIKANIHAINLLYQLEKESRNPSPEEKQILARYVGWGGIPNVFNDALARYRDPDYRERLGDEQLKKYENWEKKYGQYYDQLKKLLDDDEFRKAQESTINAHYTSREVIQHGLWNIIQRLGYQGGRAIEPAGGIGHIIGLTPDIYRNAIRWTAVELDALSSRILSKLYPQAKVHTAGFQNAPIPNNRYSLVVSNFPFGKTGPYDERYKNVSLHNYFFLKSLDALKPGGLMVAITSISTMDNEASAKARKMIAERADFIGAIRLPDNAFKENANTEVTTDILIFRKKDGNPFPSAETFQNTREITTKDGKQYDLNEYFVRNPSMMLGEMEFAGKMYAEGTITLSPFKDQQLPAQLDGVVKKLPENISTLVADAIDDNEKTVERGKAIKEGAFTVQNGEVFQANGNLMESVSGTPQELNMIKSFVELRDAYKELLNKQLDPAATPEDLAVLRKKLNDLYDNHVKKFNYLLRQKNTLLSEDPEFPLVAGLEELVVVPREVTITSGPDKGKLRTVNDREYRKNDVFKERTMAPRAEPTSAATIEDAVNISINYRNRVDPAYIAGLISSTEENTRTQLLESGKVFENPDTGLLETPDEYLSGNVRKKLRDAELAATQNSAYEKNAEALRPVIPNDILLHEIGFTFGAPWMPAEYVQQFLQDELHVDSEVTYVPALNKWKVKAYSGYSGSANTDTWGTADMQGHEIVEDALNMRQSLVYRTWKDADGSTHREKDAEASLAAQAMQEKLKERFTAYVRSNNEWKAPLERLYNDRMNSYVERKWQGPSWEHYPGSSTAYTLRAHQKAMVSRILANSTGVWHSVGTGKTLIMITAAMEMKRLGMSKKTTIVAQNATVSQFARTAKQQYPMARILAPDENERSADQRTRLLSRIASQNWDIIIIPQSFAALIPDDPDRVEAFMVDEINTMKEAMIATKEEEGGNSPSVKMLVQAIKRLEEKLEEQADRRTDITIHWDNLGIDALFVDEAHAYKKLGFTTSLGNIRGIDTGRSQRAFSMFMKVRSVQERNAGKNVVMATGTPITNTMAEAWTAIKFLRPDLLKEYGIETFDSFAATFGQVVPIFEYTSTAQWKVVSRFAKYQNGPELIKLLRTAADIVLAEDVKIPGVPKVKGGKPEEVRIKRSVALENFIKQLRQTLKQWENLKGKEKMMLRHIPLLIYNQAKQAAIDFRLIHPDNEEDPNGKVATAAKNIIARYNQYADQKASQLVFADMFQSPPTEDKFLDEEKKIPNPAYGKGKRFNLYHDLRDKLVRGGIPKNEIAIMREEGDTDAKRARLFDAVNAGRIRVLIGATENMGMGVNVNERLQSLHHLDAPPRPMDLEQRNGRIIRQGNMFPEVEILIYGVEQTLDATAFQRLVTKQKFINQAMRGNLSSRTFEDPADEVQMSLQEIMADLTGDPLALQRHVEATKVQQLESLKAAHDQKLRAVNKDIQILRESTIPDAIEHYERHKEYQKILDQKFPDGKVSEVTILNNKYTGQAVGEALSTFFSSQFKQALENYKKSVKLLISGTAIYDITPIRIGEYGFHGQIETRVQKFAENANEVTQHASWFLAPSDFAKTGAMMIHGNFNQPSGFLISFGSAVKNHPEALNDYKKTIEQKQQEVVDKEAYLTTPFEKEDELAMHKKNLAEIEAELQAKSELTDKEDEAEESPEGGVQYSKSSTGKPKTGRPVGALPSRLEQFVAPRLLAKQNIFTKIVAMKNTILAAWAPTLVGGASKTASMIVRMGLGDIEHKKQVATNLFKQARKHFIDWTGPVNKVPIEIRENFLRFTDAFESGTPLPNPEENNAILIAKQLNDERWKIIQELKHTDSYIDNYFPHLYKHPEQAAAILAKYYGRRPMEGTKGYLKKRTIPTFRAAIELGLEPLSWNPIDIILASIFDKDRLIMANNFVDDFKEHGLWEFHRLGDRPLGWGRVDDKFGTVFGPPAIPVSEYVDKIKYEQLLRIMQNFGIKYERNMTIRGGGDVLGYHQGNKVVTRFATPLGVLIHEIGHHLDEKYNLGDQFVNNKATKDELRKLADLRYEGEEARVSEYYKKYVRQKSEKMANMIDAFVNIPDQFKKIAPNTWAMLNRLIDRTPELQPLREIRSSLVTMKLENEVKHGGMLIYGYYWMPEEAAAIVNNYLSPGFSGSVFYQAIRGLNNNVNQVQLGLSGFHLMFTAVNSMVSHMGTVGQLISLGRPIPATIQFFTYPISPIMTYLRGSRVAREYIAQNPQDTRDLEAIILANGHVRQGLDYQAENLRKFMDALRAHRFLSATFRFPWALIQASSHFIMGHVVPIMKVGMFVEKARLSRIEAEKKGWSREELIMAWQNDWDYVDSAAGQVVYDNWFWKRGLLQFLQQSTRSLGWNAGTPKLIIGGALDIPRQAHNFAFRRGKFRISNEMAYVIAGTFSIAMMCALKQKIMTGKNPESIKDFYYPKNGLMNPDGTEQRETFPSYAKDVFAYIKRPLTTVEDKLAPIWNMMAQMWRNHDYYGTEIRNPDDPVVKQFEQEVKFVLKQYIPFSVRGAMKVSESGGSWEKQLSAITGIQPAPSYIDIEPWEQKMQDYLQRRGTNYTTPEKREVTDFRREFVEKTKMGKLTQADLKKAAQLGLITREGGIDNRTLEMITSTPEELQFKRLSLPEAVEVFKMMPIAVQNQYKPLMIEKIANAKNIDALLPKTE